MAKYSNTIIQDLQNTLKTYQNQLDAWEQVKRVHKKDGSDFANLFKNIEGAKKRTSSFETFAEPYLQVYYKDYKGSYQSDDLKIFENRCSKDDSRGNVVQTSWGTYNHLFTLDEIFAAVEDWKQNLKQWIQRKEQEIANAQKMIDKADAIIDQIKVLLNSSELLTDHGYFKSSNSLGYKIEDYIKTNTHHR